MNYQEELKLQQKIDNQKLAAAQEEGEEADITRNDANDATMIADQHISIEYMNQDQSSFGIIKNVKSLKSDQAATTAHHKSSQAISQNKSTNNNTTLPLPNALSDTKHDDTYDEKNRPFGNIMSNYNMPNNNKIMMGRSGNQSYAEDGYFDDHSRNNILPHDEDYEESFEGDQQSMYSHVVSQHPLSMDEEQPGIAALNSYRSDSSQNAYVSKKLVMSRKEIAPLVLYQFLFLVVIILSPLMLYENCKTSPHFVAHIIFIILQIMLLIGSTFYHRRKLQSTNQLSSNNGGDNGLLGGSGNNGSLLKSQGRCCREIISQMKLIDTYTNLCFFSLVLHERQFMKGYIFAISLVSVAIFMAFKVFLTFYFMGFTLIKLRPRKEIQDPNVQQDELMNTMKRNIADQSSNQKILTQILIYLDQETIAKLYDSEADLGTDSQIFLKHKQRYSYFKTICEDAPLAAMQALYLSTEVCASGLNSIIIISLYFNSICILYSLSNLCSSKNKEGSGSKGYKKEMDRLRDYYDGNQARVIAEFYIEDQMEIQNMKVKALNDYLSYHNYVVESFNFSTNQMGEETLNYLHEIIVNSSETLDDLTLSRCKLKSTHLSYFYFPQALIRLNLSENRIGDSGAKLLSNYILEKNRQSLISVNLEHNNISEIGAQTLLKAIQQSAIYSINLRKNRMGTPTDQQPSMSMGLMIEYYKVLQINYIKYFVSKRNTIKRSTVQEQFTVKLSMNEAIDRILMTLFKVDTQQTVKSLDLSMRFFRTLRSNQQKEKNGQTSKQLYIKGLQYYDDEQRLLLISIHYNANLLKLLPDKQLLQTLQTLQTPWFYLGNSVTTMNLSSNWLSQKAQTMIFSSLSSLTNLKEIYYNNNYIKNSALFFKSLEDCAAPLELLQLKSCSFYGNFDIQFKDFFSKLQQLRSLHFNYSNISDTTIISLAECIPQMKQIEKINIKQCGVSCASMDHLFEALASQHHTIKSLNLSQNDLRGIQLLGKFIKQSKTIEKLKLSKTQLGDNEIKQISYGLKINKSLQILDLSQNQIQNVGQIKDGISCNIALEKLDLSNNVIDDSGLIKLSQSLVSNGCLETLSVSFNDYQVSGLIEFFKIFTDNDSLTNVSFSIPAILSDQDHLHLSGLLISTLTTMKGHFKRLEILGNVKKLNENEFFYKFIRDGAFNIEELILDSILKQNQLIDIINALKVIITGPQSQQELEKFNNHKLKRITFIKPQEFSEEIQILENLLEEKQTLFFLPQQLQLKISRMKQLQDAQQQLQEILALNGSQQQQQPQPQLKQHQQEFKQNPINNNKSPQQEQSQQQHYSNSPNQMSSSFNSPDNYDNNDDSDSDKDSDIENSQRSQNQKEQMKVPGGNQILMGNQNFEQNSVVDNKDRKDNRI